MWISFQWFFEALSAWVVEGMENRRKRDAAQETTLEYYPAHRWRPAELFYAERPLKSSA